MIYLDYEDAPALSDRPAPYARKLPWRQTEEEYEATMAELAALDSRWM